MVILVLNCGSSSVKYCLFSIDLQEICLVRGSVRRIGLSNTVLIQESTKGRIEQQVAAENHRQAIYILIEALTKPHQSVLPSIDSIEAVGHRVVHGGEAFTYPVKLDEKTIKALRRISNLAPLHNPHNLAGIEAVSCFLPDAIQVAVFDTAFHQTLPSYAYLYALPLELYEKFGIRRYGFHGTSHRFVMQEAARIVRKPVEKLRIISCHLGNGSSISAIKYGKSVDTSMGFTPLEGLVMGTRCGDLDPTIPMFLLGEGSLDQTEVSDILNKKSGLVGLSGYSSDMMEIIKAVYSDEYYRIFNKTHPHHEKAKLALEIFIYRLRKYIGAYAAALGGLDVLIFTGGIGQNSSVIPNEACNELQFMGIEIGPARNMANGCFELSKPTSKVKVLVIPTDEELMIARDTWNLLNE
jgi:acetate kinase